MSAAFGEAAARLSGQVALMLGWSPDRFWAATPEELATILVAAAPPSGATMNRATLDALMEQDGDK